MFLCKCRYSLSNPMHEDKVRSDLVVGRISQSND